MEQSNINEIQSKWHPSMRGWFAGSLYNHMSDNGKACLLVGDLGWGVFDKHFEDFPDRTINCGAAEQSMMGIAIGLALKGFIPFVYSITTFLLYRPFETIKLYIDHEKVPVKLCGSGRDKDYKHDGISHDATGAEKVLNLFPNIFKIWPQTKEDIPSLVEMMVYNKLPTFISLKR